MKSFVFSIFLYLLVSLPFMPFANAIQLSAEDDAPVPKSETFVIPGSLNDSKQTAADFNEELEYVFGSAESFQKASEPRTTIDGAWRKTSFSNSGTMVVTLDFDANSDYNVEVFSSCSNENFCQSYRFANFKTCVMNIWPGEYYFKVLKISGTGSYTLDVDLIKDKMSAKVNVPECLPACSSNLGCDDKNALTLDSCVNPGKPDAFCVYKQKMQDPPEEPENQSKQQVPLSAYLVLVVIALAAGYWFLRKKA